MATTKRQGSAAPPAEPEPNAAMEQAKADLAAKRQAKVAEAQAAAAAAVAPEAPAAEAPVQA